MKRPTIEFFYVLICVNSKISPNELTGALAEDRSCLNGGFFYAIIGAG